MKTQSKLANFGKKVISAREMGAIIPMIILYIVIAFNNPNFFATANLIDVCRAASFTFIIAAPLTCLMLTLGFCLLAARPGGTGVCRVAFALRLLLPVALAVFAGFSLSSASAAGLFPLLGAGVRPLLLAALKQPD